jgi:hypothetical protein
MGRSAKVHKRRRQTTQALQKPSSDTKAKPDFVFFAKGKDTSKKTTTSTVKEPDPYTQPSKRNSGRVSKPTTTSSLADQLKKTNRPPRDYIELLYGKGH